ncbi:hypothetical protein, partial [Streptomyces doebereineriae]
VSTEVENVKAAVNTSAVTRNLASAPDAPDAAGETATAASKVADDSSAGTPAKSKVKDILDGMVKPRGATDLSDGHKALPGVTKSLSRTGEQVRTAVKDAQDQVSSSIKKLGDAVKKATGGTAKPTGEKAVANDSAGEKDAA